jgi:hypothetical protein
MRDLLKVIVYFVGCSLEVEQSSNIVALSYPLSYCHTSTVVVCASDWSASVMKYVLTSHTCRFSQRSLGVIVPLVHLRSLVL